MAELETWKNNIFKKFFTTDSLRSSILDQGLFQWVGSSHQVAKVLEFQFQH